MDEKRQAKKRAILRQRLFYVTCISVLLAVLSVLVLVFAAIANAVDKNEGSSSIDESKPTISSTVEDDRPQYVQRGEYKLDAEHTNLLLVNGKNPISENYDRQVNLAVIDDKYRQPGYDLNQISQEVYPYLVAMCEAAFADDVALKVCSPYRSFNIQKMLFERQVNKWKNTGLSEIDAETKAATIVSRPGTSEHQTGLAIDFVKANEDFENHPAFEWLNEHAAEYGFILRYPEDKQEKTGVIYESWHYRFVGIYEAQKIKKSGLCLEEYIEKNKE